MPALLVKQRWYLPALLLLTIKNDYSSESFRVRVLRGFFQRQSANKVILKIGLFTSIDCISNQGHRSESGDVFKIG